MVADINLTENSIILEGAEVQSTGPVAGYSFHDRTGKGRWVWYAKEGAALLWNEKNRRDVIKVNPFAVLGESSASKADGSVEIAELLVSGHLQAKVEMLEGIQVSRAGGETHLSGLITKADALVLQPQFGGSSRFSDPLRYALLTEHDRTGKDRLTINYLGHYSEGVRIEGNVEVTGALTQASSVALKEKIADLSAQEAVDALNELNPVTFQYKADIRRETHAGFIAEDVPDLLANADRDRLSSMEIVAVLTKVIQEQQHTISQLVVEVDTLKRQRGSG